MIKEFFGVKNKFMKRTKNENLSELVARRLDEIGVPMRELERLNKGKITQAFLSQLKQGKPQVNPRVSTIKNLSEVLEVPIEEVFHAALRMVA